MTVSALNASDAAEHASGGASDTRVESAGDVIDRLTGAVHTARPYSWRSLGIAVASLVLASALRGAFGTVAAHFPLTFYILAILAVELLAGLPAAVGTSVASVVIVWWAFVPPYFQFDRPNGSDAALLLLFVTECGAAVLIGYWCRLALVRLHQHETAYRTVARELAHRNKNTLAVVEAIVRRSLADERERADAIMGRLRALGHANDLLTSPSVRSVPLQSLLAYEFAPYGAERVLTRGQAVELPAETARNVLLIVHELTTNAVKYGGLSRPDGRVTVEWVRKGRAVVIAWTERGGPPCAAPKRRGFGSSLMGQSAAALGGRIEPRYAPEGFSCSLSFPLPE